MSVPLTINGVTFNYPQEFDTHWGPTLTAWSTAVTNALKPLTGGFLTLSPYPSTGINFANATNTGFIALTINGSNQLTFNGVPIGATTTLTNGHILVGNVSNVPTDVAMSGDITITNTGVTSIGAGKITDSEISTSAGIALTKLASTTAYDWYVANSIGVLTPIAVTASKAVITDANGLPSASSVTSTELGYVSGVTSSIQTQINAITAMNFYPTGGITDFAGTVAPSGWLLCDGSSYATATYPALFTAIGYTWGGSGSSFNVPNLSRSTTIGAGGTGTAIIGNAVGNVGGEETHTLISPEIPATGVTVSVTNPPHSHGEQAYENLAGGSNFHVQGGYGNIPTLHHVDTTDAATTSITASGTVSGGGGAHNNIQPSAVVLKIIKT